MRRSLRSQSCEARIGHYLNGRLADLRYLWVAYSRGSGDKKEGTIGDYGLGFDYVPGGTFSDQREAYFRHQLSWGGPSDEFRFFVNPDFSCHRIEYWFLDWFDGAHRTIAGPDEMLLLDVWEWVCMSGVAKAELNRTL
jgi:hypothetical protein